MFTRLDSQTTSTCRNNRNIKNHISFKAPVRQTTRAYTSAKIFLKRIVHTTRQSEILSTQHQYSLVEENVYTTRQPDNLNMQERLQYQNAHQL